MVLNPAVPYLILPATALGCFSIPTLDAVENILVKGAGCKCWKLNLLPFDSE